jgi:hypothetical protein
LVCFFITSTALDTGIDVLIIGLSCWLVNALPSKAEVVDLVLELFDAVEFVKICSLPKSAPSLPICAMCRKSPNGADIVSLLRSEDAVAFLFLDDDEVVFRRISIFKKPSESARISVLLLLYICVYFFVYDD